MIEIFNSVASDAWVGLAGVIFGSLLTTLGVWLTNRSNTKQALQRLQHEERVASESVRKERLEELYILVCHWSNLFFKHYLNLNLVMKGSLSYNDYLDMITAPSDDNADYNRIQMIVDIYGEDVRSYYEAVEVAKVEVNYVGAQHKQAYKLGESGLEFIGPAKEAQLVLGDAFDEFKFAIAKAARA